MSTSNIEWTEQVWNPLVGCTVHSPGCTNCYAMKMAHRLEAMAREQMMLRDSPLEHYCGTTRKVNGKAVWTGKLGFSEAALLKPLERRKPTRWFVNSMSDLFHQDVPDEWIDRMFAVMALCPQHTFQVLTKRSARMREYCNDRATPRRVYGWVCDWATDGVDDIVLIAPGFPASQAPAGRHVRLGVWPLGNVWKGVSVEDQTRAGERIPDLLATPAALRWISAEPLIGPLQIAEYMPNEVWDDLPSWKSPELDWVVAGGESGPGARGSDAEVEGWMRSLRDQCAAAGVPYFAKQGYRKHPLPADLHMQDFPA